MADGPRTKREFGDVVRQAIGDLSLRQVSIRSGVDINTLSRMKADEVPKRLDPLVAFSRAFNLDLGELLEIAGHDPLPAPPEPTPAERLGPAMIALARRLGYEGPVTLRSWGGRDNLSHAEVDQILIDLEADLVAEMEERKKRK